jgi:hypothetical protein
MNKNKKHKVGQLIMWSSGGAKETSKQFSTGIIIGESFLDYLIVGGLLF